MSELVEVSKVEYPNWATRLSFVTNNGALDLDIIDGRIEIEGIYVDERYRRRGEGSALVRAMLDEARKRKINRIIADVVLKEGACLFNRFFPEDAFINGPDNQTALDYKLD